jgi:hypothetical protein
MVQDMILVADFPKKTHDTEVKKGHQLKSTASDHLLVNGIDSPSKLTCKLTAPFVQPEMAI